MTPGKIAFLGSGETSHAGGAAFERLAAELPRPVRVVILETPAGFEPNSAQVAERISDFIRTRLAGFSAKVELIPARKRGTAFSPDDRGILAPLLEADLVFMGPGSPTYAVRQLQGSLAWDVTRARHRLGAALAFASAATIAVGAWSLPVYEVYKVGEDVTAPPGLNLFSDFGLELSFIPHWNNAEGGKDLDTSRCFLGLERFAAWSRCLPPSNTTVGLDEHTWLIIDLEAQSCEVGGVGGVSLVRESDSKSLRSGTRFGLRELGEYRALSPLEKGIDPGIWELIEGAARGEADRPTGEVLELEERRREARARRDWTEADRLRQQIVVLGWDVQDTDADAKLVKR